jgi:uncharacterized membrane-anchored protein
MKKIVLCLLLLNFYIGFSQDKNELNDSDIEDIVSIEDEYSEEEIAKIVDSINNSFTFKTGVIDLNNGTAKLTIPKGYKYLDPEQSAVVLTDYWENPPNETLGLLFPENSFPIGETLTYAVEITYSEDGFIDDDDAKDIDYDDLEKEIKNDTKLASKERVKMGYETIDFVGWASDPYYDENNKKLHWAQEFKFGSYEENTLNYNIRVLGRKGYLNLNVIGDMDVLPLVKNDVNQILSSVEFNKGFKYSEFNPDVDEVAAYGIGGLIAGKVLAKAGFFALILKFWKFIAIGAVALFAGFKKRIFGSKEEA